MLAIILVKRSLRPKLILRKSSLVPQRKLFRTFYARSELLISCANQYSAEKLVSMKGSELWPVQLALHKPSGEYTNALALVEAWLALAIASSEPEMGFSLMERIKSDWRSCSDNTSLNDLMQVAMTHKDIKSNDPSRAVSLWWKSAGRRHTDPHGQLNMSKSKSKSRENSS